MTDDELIARLDNLFIMLEEEGKYTKANTAAFAKDRIEAMITEQSNLIVAAHRQGYDQARAVCSELRRAMAERIMEHEAKLAKAVEALSFASNMDATDWSEALDVKNQARATLAELRTERRD